MTDRIESLIGGAGADPHRSSIAADPQSRNRRRVPTVPTPQITLAEALSRLSAAAREAGQDLQFRVEAVDGVDMVVTRTRDGTLVQKVGIAEALLLAASLAGTAGGLFSGSL